MSQRKKLEYSLFKAVRLNEPRKVESLVKSIKDTATSIDIRNYLGDTALQLATYLGHQKIVRILIEGKADTNLRCGYGRTALMWATINGHQEIVHLLLTEGKANPDIQGPYRSTALMFAAECGRQDIFRLLITVGNANIELQNRSGSTVLQSGHPDIKKALEDLNKLAQVKVCNLVDEAIKQILPIPLVKLIAEYDTPLQRLVLQRHSVFRPKMVSLPAPTSEFKLKSQTSKAHGMR